MINNLNLKEFHVIVGTLSIEEGHRFSSELWLYSN